MKRRSNIAKAVARTCTLALHTVAAASCSNRQFNCWNMLVKYYSHADLCTLYGSVIVTRNGIYVDVKYWKYTRDSVEGIKVVCFACYLMPLYDSCSWIVVLY